MDVPSAEPATTPVFVDETGRRGRWARRVGQAITLVVGLYVLLLSASFARAPWVPGLRLPGLGSVLAAGGPARTPVLGPEATSTPLPVATTSTTTPAPPSTTSSSVRRTTTTPAPTTTVAGPPTTPTSAPATTTTTGRRPTTSTTSTPGQQSTTSTSRPHGKP